MSLNQSSGTWHKSTKVLIRPVWTQESWTSIRNLIPETWVEFLESQFLTTTHSDADTVVEEEYFKVVGYFIKIPITLLGPLRIQSEEFLQKECCIEKQDILWKRIFNLKKSYLGPVMLHQ